MGERRESLTYEKLPLEMEDPLVEEVIEAPAPVKVSTLDDLAKMGRYALLVILFSEFCLLQGAGNMTYMIFGGLHQFVHEKEGIPGAAPKVSCIGENFTIENVCAEYGSTWKELKNCTIHKEYEFKSINVEVRNYLEETRKCISSSIYCVKTAPGLNGAFLYKCLESYWERYSLE